MVASVSPKSVRQLTLLLFFFALFQFFFLKHYIYDQNSPNRVSLCLAILEDCSLIIDKYHHFTEDICFRDGHYYCDKAPGTSFLAFPFIAALYYGFHAVGRTDFASPDPDEPLPEPRDEFKLMLIAGSAAVSLVCALAVAVLFRLGLVLGLSTGNALLGALLLGFGTPFGVWATVLIGHSLAAALALLGFAFAVFLLQAERFATDRNSSSFFAWFGVGFLLAYNVWVEYTAAIPSCMIGLFILYMKYRNGRRVGEVCRSAGILFLGALPVALAFCAYNNAAYGGPFRLGYLYVDENFPRMQQGFYGVNLPSPVIFFRSLVDPLYGLLWYSPIFIFSPYLAFRNIRSGRMAAVNVLCLSIAVYYFLLNSSYTYWAHSDIPARHVTAAFPFLVLPITLAWNEAGSRLRTVLRISLVWSFVFSGAAMNVLPLEGYYKATVPAFYLLGDIFCGGTINLFYYAGLRPPQLAFLPIVVSWIVFGHLAWKSSGKQRNFSASESTGHHGD